MTGKHIDTILCGRILTQLSLKKKSQPDTTKLIAYLTGHFTDQFNHSDNKRNYQGIPFFVNYVASMLITTSLTISVSNKAFNAVFIVSLKVFLISILLSPFKSSDE